MKKITSDRAKKILSDQRNNGNHVDSRVFREIDNPGLILEFEIEDKDLFLSLIWHAIDASRLLTSPDKPRTLKDITERIKKNDYTFEKLSKNIGEPEKIHDPHWFLKCLAIDKNFKYAKFGYVILTPATNDEINQSPNGSFYIFDGTHKCLVLANKLNTEFYFQSIKCLLLLPRRH